MESRGASWPEAGGTQSAGAAVCALEDSVAGTGIWFPVVGSPVSGKVPPPRSLAALAEDWKASERASGGSLPEASELSVEMAGPTEADDEEEAEATLEEGSTAPPLPASERKRLEMAPPGPPPPVWGSGS